MNINAHFKVAPGMKVVLDILLDTQSILGDADAIKIKDEIEIVTESEYLHVPVIGEVRRNEGIADLKIRPNVRIVEEVTTLTPVQTTTVPLQEAS